MLFCSLEFKLEVGDFLQVVFVLLADVLPVHRKFLSQSTVLVPEISIGVLELLHVEGLVVLIGLGLPELVVFKLKLFELNVFLVKLLLVLFRCGT